MFSSPLGLLGLLALPAIVALHLFKRRYPPRTVSALFLFGPTTLADTSGRNREPLRRSASLLLELLGAALLALALAGPRFGSASSAPHLVVVFDGTASMNAASAVDGTTALERARTVARAAIEELPARARVTLIRSGPEPAIVLGPLAFRLEADAALDEITAPFPGADRAAAFDLATELGRGAPVLYITDTPEIDVPKGIVTRGVGRAASNSGIVAAMRSRADGSETVRLAVRNFGPEPSSCSLRIVRAQPTEQGEESPIATREVALEPGEARSFRFELQGGTPAITAHLVPGGAGSSSDSLPLDDVATLAPAPRRTVALAVDVAADTARALGFESVDEAAARWASLLPDARVAEDLASAHLALTADAPVPAPAWSLVLRSESPEPVHLVGPFLMDRTHPLLEGVTLEGVLWTVGAQQEARGLALVLGGSRPLLGESTAAEGARRFDLALDPTRSTLGRSPDWPILLTNAAELRRAALPGPVRTSLGAGESFEWSGAAAGEWTLTSPTGETTSIRTIGSSSDLLTPRLTEPGLWTIAHEDTELPKRRAEIGVTLASPEESDLRALSSSEGAPLRAGRGTNGPDDPLIAGPAGIEALLAVLGLLALALDWWVVREGRTRGTR